MADAVVRAVQVGDDEHLGSLRSEEGANPPDVQEQSTAVSIQSHSQLPCCLRSHSKNTWLDSAYHT